MKSGKVPYIQGKVMQKLILYILIFSFITGIISTGIRFYIDYKRDLTKIENWIKHLETTHKSTFIHLVQMNNQAQAHLHLEELLRLQSIAHVTLFNSTGKKLSKGRVSPRNTYSYELFLQEGKKQIGSVYITVDSKQLYSRLFIILITQAIKLMVFAFFLAVLFHFLIEKHLQQLTSYLNNIETSTSKILPLPSSFNPRNELSQLTNTIHQTFHRLQQNFLSQQTANSYLKKEIAENHHRYRQLSVSEKNYRDVFETCKDAILIVNIESEKFININPAACQIYGYTEHEFLKLSWSQLCSDSLLKALYQEEVSSSILQHKKKNGNLFFVDISTSLYRQEERNRAVMIVRDITEKKEIEAKAQQLLEETQLLNKQLEASETELVASLDRSVKLNQTLALNKEKLRAIINVLPDLLFLMDEKGEYLEVYISNYNQQELDNHSYNLIEALFEPSTFELLKKTIFHTLATGEVNTLEYTISIAQSQRWFELKTAPLQMKIEERKCVVWLARDITEHKRKSIELQKITKELIHRNKELENFTYIASHNLRAPVANILGLVHIYDTKNPMATLNTQVVQHLDMVAGELDTIIKDLHQILETKTQINEERIYIDLSSLLKKVLTTLNQQIQLNQAEITHDFLEVSHIYSIQSYIRSILYHLLSNALKYKASDRIPKISITTSIQHDKICLSVSDNGLGIDLMKQKNRIFGLYQRFHTHIEGKGLGLHLVKTQVEALQGEIEVLSKLNEGTTFNIYFEKKTAMYEKDKRSNHY